jgi:hypothetical protein
MVVFLLKESRLFLISPRFVDLHSTQECPRIYMNYTTAVHTLIMHVVRWLVLIKSIILVCRSNAKYAPFSPHHLVYVCNAAGRVQPSNQYEIIGYSFLGPQQIIDDHPGARLWYAVSSQSFSIWSTVCDTVFSSWGPSHQIRSAWKWYHSIRLAKFEFVTFLLSLNGPLKFFCDPRKILTNSPCPRRTASIDTSQLRNCTYWYPIVTGNAQE